MTKCALTDAAILFMPFKVTLDNQEALDFDEFRFYMAVFAATDADVILAAFDDNYDGILVEDEVEEFWEWFEAMLEENTDYPCVYYDGLRKAWRNAQG